MGNYIKFEVPGSGIEHHNVGEVEDSFDLRVGDSGLCLVHCRQLSTHSPSSFWVLTSFSVIKKHFFGTKRAFPSIKTLRLVLCLALLGLGVVLRLKKCFLQRLYRHSHVQGQVA